MVQEVRLPPMPRGCLRFRQSKNATQAIDADNDAHRDRAENPLAHLHEDKAPGETDNLKSFH